MTVVGVNISKEILSGNLQVTSPKTVYTVVYSWWRVYKNKSEGPVATTVGFIYISDLCLVRTIQLLLVSMSFHHES